MRVYVYICTCSTHHRKCAAEVDSNPLLLELPYTPWYHCGWKSAFNNLEKSTRICFSFWELHLLLCNLEHKSGTSKVLYQQSRFYHVTWASLNSISHFLTRVCIHTNVLCCVFVNCALSHTTLFTLKVDKIDYSTIDCFCTVNDLCTNYCFTSETRE